jgi:hypothetical protein
MIGVEDAIGGGPCGPLFAVACEAEVDEACAMLELGSVGFGLVIKGEM